MSAKKISLKPASKDERQVTENTYLLFIHDQWAYSDFLPNQFDPAIRREFFL